MTNPHQFTSLDGVISPNPWMQYRHVANASAASLSKRYGTSGGVNKDDPVHTLLAKWTNDSPVAQSVYGQVTRGGAQVALQARSRGYFSTRHGVSVGRTLTAPIDMREVSRFGIGADLGRAGLLGVGTGFAISEIDKNSATVRLLPQITGMFRVEPGESIWAQVDVRFVTEQWENSKIDGGDTETYSGFISGDTRVDLYAMPAFAPPPALPTPTVVGVRSSANNTFHTTPALPAGTAAGDILLAVLASQLGAVTDLVPEQPGWSLLHERDGGLLDTRLRVYWRVAGGNEPASYSFGTGLLAEAITHLIAVRNADLPTEGNWYAASALRKQWWERDDGHGAPSIDRSGQLLICLSYVPIAFWQAPVTQTPPAGMTEVSDAPSALASASVAVKPNPPRPTGTRVFLTSKQPEWTFKRSIALSVLVPGKPPA